FDGGYVTFGGGAYGGRITGTGIQGVSKSSTSSQQDQDWIVMPIWKDASYFGDASPRTVDDAQIEDKDELHDEDDATEESHDGSSLKENGTADQQVNTARPDINNGSREVSTDLPEVNIATPEDLVGPSPASEDSHVEDQEIELGNIPQSYAVPTTPHTRIHKDHPIEHVIGDVQSSVQTRRMKTSYSEKGFLSAIYEGKTHQDLHTCLFVCFLSQEEPKRVSQALRDPAWVEAMQEELLQFKLQKVWILVDLPKGHRAIGTKWVYRNKKDERGIVIRNKARLVAQGHTQEEGIDYDEVFAPMARIEAIRQFLDYASYMGFMVYQMDVKSAFLYGQIQEEHPELGMTLWPIISCAMVLKEERLTKHYASRDIRDISCLFKSIWMTLSLDLQRRNYMFNYSDVKSASTPTDLEKPLVQDGDAADVDEHLYRSTIGSLMYLIASMLDIIFLKGKPSLGLWSSKDSPLELVDYTDSDYAGATQDRKSTTGRCQFLGNRLISWQCKKQTVVATSTTKAEYVAAASCCRQLDDQDGLSSIPNSEIFEQLALMGYHTDLDKLTFQKGAFSPQWRFLIHSILHCISPKKTAWEQFSSNIATAVISEHHLPTPHESPLHVVHSHGSDEGNLKLNELTNLVTTLSESIGVLEDDLRKTKKTYSSAYTKLILRVKKLESQIKTGKARRKARVVLSDDEVIKDDSSKQGKKLSDADVQEKASTETELFIQEVTPAEVIQDQGSSEKGSAKVSTAGGTVTYTRRSEEQRKRKDKGKAIMIEPEPKKKSKKEIEQERLSIAEAIKLEEQTNEEQMAQIARDEEIARQ
ncbi:putative ribonuclease H-like domain-containing protein, partial [Tanacetum coccineum]